MKSNIILVEGVVGVGKTTLSRILSEELGFSLFEEPVVDNPFLADFYKDPSRWSFATQIYFLTQRFKAMCQAGSMGRDCILDRSILGDSIFARLLAEKENKMTLQEYNTYLELVGSMQEFSPKPTALIYLRSENIESILKKINKRGRDYELNVDLGYWKNLGEYYKEVFDYYCDCSKLVIDADNIDFVENLEDRNNIIDKIKKFYSSI